MQDFDSPGLFEAFFDMRIGRALEDIKISDLDLWQQFESDSWKAPLMVALTSIHLNRPAFSAVDLATYPALPREPVPLMFKKTVLMCCEPGNTPAPGAVDPIVFKRFAEAALERVLYSSQDMAIFLRWFLDWAPRNTSGADRPNRDIRIWQGNRRVGQASLFQPYRYERQDIPYSQWWKPIPDFFPADLKAHIRNYETGFMEAIQNLLSQESDDPREPTDAEIFQLEDVLERDLIGVPPAYDDGISKALIIIKAISGWIWKSLNEEPEVQAAFSAELCNRAENISHLVGYSQEWDSASLQIAVGLLASVPQILVLGISSSGQGYIRSGGVYEPERLLSRSEVHFLLTLDYQLGLTSGIGSPPYTEKLWLDFNPCEPGDVWDKIANACAAIQRNCLEAAKLSTSVANSVVLAAPIVQGFLGKLPGTREDRRKDVSDLKSFAYSMATSLDIKPILPEIFDDYHQVIDPYLVWLCDYVCGESGVSIPTIEDLYSTIGTDYEWVEPLGVLLLWEYENRAVKNACGKKSLASTRRLNTIESLIAVGIVETADTSRKDSSMEEYPFSISHNEITFKNPPTMANLTRRLRRASYVNLC